MNWKRVIVLIYQSVSARNFCEPSLVGTQVKNYLQYFSTSARQFYKKRWEFFLFTVWYFLTNTSCIHVVYLKQNLELFFQSLYQFFSTWCEINDITVSARSYMPINNLPLPTWRKIKKEFKFNRSSSVEWSV